MKEGRKEGRNTILWREKLVQSKIRRKKGRQEGRKEGLSAKQADRKEGWKGIEVSEAPVLVYNVGFKPASPPHQIPALLSTDLLANMLVTWLTSHDLRFPLKALAPSNTSATPQKCK
jgi:hypothetical protein